MCRRSIGLGPGLRLMFCTPQPMQALRQHRTHCVCSLLAWHKQGLSFFLPRDFATLLQLPAKAPVRCWQAWRWKSRRQKTLWLTGSDGTCEWGA